MIIFLFGPDTYRSGKKLREIVEGYKKAHKSGLNLKYLDGSGITLKDLEDETKQNSIFKEKKLIILADCFSNSQFKEGFVKKGKEFAASDDIFIFHERDKVLKKDKLFKFLQKHAKSQEFALLTGQKLRNWLKKEFESRGGSINSSGLERFVDFVENDPWLMVNELQKLVHFRNGKEIKAADIELLVKPKVEPNIFKTIEAIASRDKKTALKLLKHHLKKGDSPFYLFSMINYQFRNLLAVKDLMDKSIPLFSSGLHPFVVKKTSALAARFGFSELKDIYRILFKVDLNIKTGKTDPEAALDLLVTEI